MPRTTTGPRARGSRLASPSRARRRGLRRWKARPAKRVAGQKTASRNFFAAAPGTRRENAPQTLGTHQENAVFGYEVALGCVVAPNSEVAGIDPNNLHPIGSQVVDQGKATLIQRFNDASAELKSRGVQPGGSGMQSCNVVNGICMGLIAPIPEGWTASMEHRGRGLLYTLFGVDHWAIVANAPDGQQLLFDFWGGRPAGEDPNVWFRSRYDKPLDNMNNMFDPQRVLPDGSVSPGWGPDDARGYMDQFWPPKK